MALLIGEYRLINEPHPNPYAFDRLVLIATFSNYMLSRISQFLLVEEDWMPGENNRPSVGKLSILVNTDWTRVHRPRAGFKHTTLVLTGLCIWCSILSTKTIRPSRTGQQNLILGDKNKRNTYLQFLKAADGYIFVPSHDQITKNLK